jgi:hypothetical protein
MGAFIDVFADAPGVGAGISRGAIYRHPATIAGTMRAENATPMTAGTASPAFAFRVPHSFLDFFIRMP